MRYILFIVLAVVLASCSAKYHTKKTWHHIEKGYKAQKRVAEAERSGNDEAMHRNAAEAYKHIRKGYKHLKKAKRMEKHKRERNEHI